MKFYGVNEKECRWRLAHHLSHSDLHKLPDAEAIQIAELAKVDSYVESTTCKRRKRTHCDEQVASLRPRTPTPPRPSIGNGNELPRADRALLAAIKTIIEGERAVRRAEEISLVAARAFAGVGWNASSDVERAARKAEEIALVAAKAFAEVAAKLVEIRLVEAGNADVD